MPETFICSYDILTSLPPASISLPPGKGSGNGGKGLPPLVSKAMLDQYAETFNSNGENLLARNVISQVGVSEALLDRTAYSKINHVFSHRVRDKNVACADQKASGRCWLFAILNAARLDVMERFDLSNFEFSQSYLFFYDQLEKANFFLNSIIDTREEPLEGRVVQHLLSKPTEDGGQWDMAVNLIKKYGLVPQSVFPESQLSSHTRDLGQFLKGKLREYAATLREMHELGADEACLRETQKNCMEEVYRVLLRCLGEPPKDFDWSFYSAGKAQCIKGLTPTQFAREIVEYKPEDKACLVHDPRKQNPYGQLYTVEHLGNVLEGQAVRYVNLPIKDLKSYVIQSVLDKEPVWFGCDVGKEFSREVGVLDQDLRQPDLVFGTHVALDKAHRLEYGQSCMTHAMVITGVDLELDEDGNPALDEDGNYIPLKWQIENSWGTRYGDKGYLQMSDRWFDEYVFEVAIDKKRLKPDHAEILQQEPIALKPWDPMGSLA